MADRSPLRLGTRASKLARWQADWTAERLKQLGYSVETILITTAGDVAVGPLGQIGGQGLFTKRIQQALLNDEIDFAVHSLKDLPTESVAGLCLAAVPTRASCGDVLVSATAASLRELPQAARVGTGSKRRQSQLLHVRPDLRVSDIRGNVDTRLHKLDDGQFEAIVLAQAGLERLGLSSRITQELPRSIMLPAVGQGALGLEARTGDDRTRNALVQLNDRESQAAVLAERSLLAALRAGCLGPVGAWGRVEESQLRLEAVVLSEDGCERIAVDVRGPLDQPVELGRHAAKLLADQGADQLIAQSRRSGQGA